LDQITDVFPRVILENIFRSSDDLAFPFEVFLKFRVSERPLAVVYLSQ